MIVVADTSVILNLACVGYDHLLQQLYHDVRIPPAVAQEFNRQATITSRFRGLTLANWIRTQAPAAVPSSLRSNVALDIGEIEAIALAVEIKADALLVDEQIGRAAAAAHQLRTFGVVGVLLQAKAAGLLPLVKPVLDDLRTRAGFWCSDSSHASSPRGRRTNIRRIIDRGLSPKRRLDFRINIYDLWKTMPVRRRFCVLLFGAVAVAAVALTINSGQDKAPPVTIGFGGFEREAYGYRAVMYVTNWSSERIAVPDGGYVMEFLQLDGSVSTQTILSCRLFRTSG